MKRKLTMLIGIMFLATGCSIEYNLEVDGTKLKEDFTINAEVSSISTKEELYNNYLEEYPIYSDEYEEFMYYSPYTKNDDYTYFTKSYQELENGYKFNYKANFDNKNYNKARSIKMAFDTVGIGYIKDKDSYYISASKPRLSTLGIDNLTININFKNVEVIDNNATSVNGSTYTWRLSKNSNTNINVTYKLRNNNTTPNNPSNQEQESKNDNKQNEGKQNSIFDYILVGSVILLFIIVIIGIIKYKSINKNE